jgi:GTP cyclohydrolase II
MDANGKSSTEAFCELGHSADERDYCLSAVILKDLKIDRIDLITNNIDKASQLLSYGIHVNCIVPLVSPEEIHSQYLAAKGIGPHNVILPNQPGK